MTTPPVLTADTARPDETAAIIRTDKPSTYVGGYITRYPSVFTSHPRAPVLLVPSANVVKLYSVQTALHIGTLNAHTAEVTAVIANPNNALSAYTTAINGEVIQWDLHQQTPIATRNIGTPILLAAIKPNNIAHTPNSVVSEVANTVSGDTLYCVVNAHYAEDEHSTTDDSTRVTNGRRCRVIAYDVSTKQIRVLYKPRHAIALAVSPDGTHIATVSQKTLSVYNTVNNTLIKFTHSHRLSTVQFHPSQPYLATGDEEGKLILWYKYQQTQTLVVSSLHWHSHRLTALAFTIDGSYALTGGEEAVCVVWQLHTAHKQFIPRLKAPILHITVSPDGKYYALSQADNTIRLIDAMTSKVVRTIDGLQFAHAFRLRTAEQLLLTSLVPSMPTYTGTPFVTLNGRPHTLQMFDVFNDRQVNECDVVGRNLVSRTDDELIVHTRIEHAAYLDQCQWLVTCERRSDGELTETSSLKFWHNTGRSYLLHTRIDTPHSAAIVDIVSHPHLPLLVTASYDHTFKVWRTESKKRIVSVQAIQSSHKTGEVMSDELLIWNCACIGHYRDYTIHKMAFTHDGTVLAVAYGQVITLWSVHIGNDNNTNHNNNEEQIPMQTNNESAAIMTLPQSNVNIILRQTLLHPSPSQPVLHLTFVPNTTYLVSATESTLFVSNLLTRSIEWSMNTQTTALTATNGHFVVASVKNTTDNANEEGRSRRRHKNAASTPELDDLPSDLRLFSPSSSIAVSDWTLNDLRLERRGHNRIASAVTFLSPPHGRAHPVIVYLNRHRQLVRIDNALGPNDVVHQTDDDTQNNADETMTQRSLFDRLYQSAATSTRTRFSIAVEQ